MSLTENSLYCNCFVIFTTKCKTKSYSRNTYAFRRNAYKHKRLRYLKPMKFVSRTLINSNKSKYFTFIVLFVPDSVARFYHGKYKKTLKIECILLWCQTFLWKDILLHIAGTILPLALRFFLLLWLECFIGFASEIVAIRLIQSKWISPILFIFNNN